MTFELTHSCGDLIDTFATREAALAKAAALLKVPAVVEGATSQEMGGTFVHLYASLEQRATEEAKKDPGRREGLVLFAFEDEEA